MADQPIGSHMEGMSARWQPFAERLYQTDPDRRPGILEGYAYSLADPDELIDGINDAKPAGPAPESEGDRPPLSATLADVRRLITDASWPWPGWMATGALTSLAADPGIGKTLLAMTLAWTIWDGRPWPDGLSA